jgi:tetratricopeptide (TPR) repeat protein
LEWTGEHKKATAAYQSALGCVPEHDLIWQSHLHRKVGNVSRLLRQYKEALQAYDRAETALGERADEPAPEWWQEWIQIHLERIWLHYWLGQWHEMSELASIRSIVEQHGAPTQCVNFFLALASMNNRRDRYLVSEETVDLCQIALAISQESEDPGQIAWARFMLGFNQLWHGDLDEAEKQMQAALALAEQTGDIVHQSRCLTYLTILYRKRGRLEKTHRYASKSLAAAETGQLVEYTGMAKANLAWIAWREGNLPQAEAYGQEALELWQQLPAAHSSCAFQWAALWPVIDVALAQNRTGEASAHARAMLHETQQLLPEALTTAIEKALETWDQGEPATAQAHLAQASTLAQELGYL